MYSYRRLNHDSSSSTAFKPSKSSITYTILTLSLALNAYFGLIAWKATPAAPTQTVRQSEVSKFANLTRTIPKQIEPNQVENDAEWADIWDNHTSYDEGMVALPDSYAQAMSLPRAQRWPWDVDRGIYLLNGYHNLHCLKNIRSSIEEYRGALPQSRPWAHIQHCLLVLRDDIMCNADDTPRYTGFQAQHASGVGQWRMCRDWGALQHWASSGQRSACWRHVPLSDGLRVLDRYRFCPDDSPYKHVAETRLDV